MLHGRILAAFAIAVLAAKPIVVTAAEKASEVELIPRFGYLEIAVGGEPFASYVYLGSKITRPFFSNVFASNGKQVTRHHPPVAGQDLMDHPDFHPGIWMAFGDINGNDYWRLKARVEHDSFVEKPASGTSRGEFTIRNRYLDASDLDKIVCYETCRYQIVPLRAGRLLLWDSTFTSDSEFTFGDQEEMGLGIRVATPMRVEQGDGSLPPGTGTITDAAGRKNGAEVGGNSADWCDYSGTVDGKRVGMTIFCHPDNFRPSWFHARDYGFVAANPFGRAAFKKGEPSKVVVKPGEQLRLRYGILVHAEDDGQPPDLHAAYHEYLQLSDDEN